MEDPVAFGECLYNKYMEDFNAIPLLTAYPSDYTYLFATIRLVDGVRVDAYIQTTRVTRFVKTGVVNTQFLLYARHVHTASQQRLLLYETGLTRFPVRSAHTFTKEDMVHSVREIQRILPLLRYDAPNRWFETTPIVKEPFGTDYLCGKDCVVCGECTTDETSCGHALCVPCWSKCACNMCPVCRTEFIHLDGAEDDEEDDDDSEDEDDDDSEDTEEAEFEDTEEEMEDEGDGNRSITTTKKARTV